MGLFDNAVPGGNITKPLMIALGALLVAASDTGICEIAGADGGLLGGLGGLLDKLKDAGHGQVADSWVGTGQNQSIDAGTLGKALGPQVIREIAARTGLDEQELLKQLSNALPGVVDKLTPNGQVPSRNQLESLFGN